MQYWDQQVEMGNELMTQCELHIKKLLVADGQFLHPSLSHSWILLHELPAL
jgi:hypothetical protein